MSVFVQSQWAPSVLSLVYTNGSGSSQVIDKFEARNNDTASQTLTVYLVPRGTSSPDASMIRLTCPITPQQNYLCGELVGHDLDNGDSIWALSTAATTISIRCSGRTK